MKKLTFAMALFAAASLAVTPAAGAAGGSSIAAAPFLRARVSYFANYSSDHLHGGNTEFWKVRLVAGEFFSLDGTRSAAARYFTARVFPVGTDDANFRRKSAVDQGRLSAVIGLTVPRSGTYPIAVTCGNTKQCGAMRFSVSIANQVDLYVPHSARLALTGRFTVAVRTPEGKPITNRRLVVSLYGLWRDTSASMTHHVLGSSEAIGGEATFTYRLPPALAGKVISLQATAGGTGYRAASSGLCQARVT